MEISFKISNPGKICLGKYQYVKEKVCMTNTCLQVFFYPIKLSLNLICAIIGEVVKFGRYRDEVYRTHIKTIKHITVVPRHYKSVLIMTKVTKIYKDQVCKTHIKTIENITVVPRH